MAAFIHGEVSWEQPITAVIDNVRAMMAAVAHYPWRTSSLREVSDGQLVSVLAVQTTRDKAEWGGEPETLAGPPFIAADLRIDGREELVSRLALSPSEGRRLSDEALVVRSYRAWRSEFGGHIMGEGVFALWDASEQRMICWRDAAGVRPLYYTHAPGRSVIFSSDLQSIAAHPRVTARLDLEYANAFLRSGQFQHPTRTLVHGVRKLPAAHMLIIDHNGARVRRHWDPEAVVQRDEADDSAFVDELKCLLRQAISDRLSAHESGFGAHLSGGLDSSGVALTAANLLRGQGADLKTFSWAPPRDIVEPIERDERDLVEAAAEFGGVSAAFTELGPSDVIDVAYRDVALRPRETLNFEVATSRSAVAAGVQLIFSGWGGDEAIAFNGRGYFADLARHGRLLTVHRELKMRAKIHGGSLRGAWKARVLLPLLPDSVTAAKSARLQELPAEMRPEFAQLLLSSPTLEHDFPRERPGVHRMQSTLLEFGHLQYRMEAWAAHGAGLGLEYTFPLLDRRIMEFALSIPGEMFFRYGWKRWLYRTAMEGMLPEVVRWNSTKFDHAAGLHLRRVLLEPSPSYEKPLLERRGNPYVDVDILLAEQKRQRSVGSSRNQLAPDSTKPIGGGSWMAFTRLQPA